MRRHTLCLIAVVIAPSLSGCDQLGIESATQVAARRDAEGKAIGGACRHAARSIEDCYDQNKRADKAAIFAGWREMNDYMRENKLDAMPAQEPAAEAKADTPAADTDAEGGAAKPGDAKGGARAPADAGDEARKPAKGAKAAKGSKVAAAASDDAGH